MNKAEERAHILEGLLIALDNIDEVIKIIRGSQNVQIAKAGIDGAFRSVRRSGSGNRRYASACSDRSGKRKLEAEYAELMKKIEEFKAILADKKLLTWCDQRRNSCDF